MKILGRIVRTIAVLGLALHSAHAGATTLKVLTFNVRGLPFPLSPDKPARMKTLCQLLAGNAHWDVVLLQELYMNHDQKKLIACAQQGGYAYHFSKARGNLVIGLMRSGVMILSRHPILRSAALKFTSQTFQAERDALLVQIGIPGSPPIWIADIHLSPDYKGTTIHHTRERRSQLQELTRWLAPAMASSAPLIIGGDFNFGPNFNGHDPLWEELPQLLPGFAQADFPLDTTCTFCPPNSAVKAKDNTGKIDHLFGSPALRPIQGQVVFRDQFILGRKSFFLSDHFGWETEFAY